MVPIYCSIIVARSSLKLHCRLAFVLAEHCHQLVSADLDIHRSAHQTALGLNHAPMTPVKAQVWFW
jgi:hypothetical protein